VTYPPIRALEAVPVEHEGQTLIHIRDPACLAPDSLVVPAPVFLIMTLLDGRNDARAIQHILTQTAEGLIVTSEQIDELVGQLDEYYLLANTRSAERYGELEREFDALTERPASHAGVAYPADPAECKLLFEGLFEGIEIADGESPRPQGLILPHIDLRVGGKTLAKGLASLDPQAPPRLYIILGVAHQGSKNLFTLTDKSFQTPLGLVETDREAAHKLKERYGAGRLDGQFSHKTEHSIEFQAVALKYLHRNGADFKILPILCGSLHESMTPEAPPPAKQPDVGDFIATLRRLVKDYEGECCIIASVDLSHVGKKFGEERGIDPIRTESIRHADLEMLDRIESGDAEAFFDHFRPDQNARNVDAVTAVYVMLHALGTDGDGTKRIDYDQWHEEATDSMVTYAATAFY
jgi:AmmeMemoRadiSam system protein B